MTDLTMLSLVVLIIFISTLFRSAFGFGNALVAMPLLVLLIGIPAAPQLVELTGRLIALIMLLREWRDLVWKDTLVLLISSLLGLPLGLVLLSELPENTIQVILGLILI